MLHDDQPAVRVRQEDPTASMKQHPACPSSHQTIYPQPQTSARYSAMQCKTTQPHQTNPPPPHQQTTHRNRNQILSPHARVITMLVPTAHSHPHTHVS
jgi:hypothetical protein